MLRKLISIIVTGLATMASAQTLDILMTSDVHGNFFPKNYITLADDPGSLARVSTYFKKFNPETTIRLDNGDLLQGQPMVYYYNYVDTISPHIAAEIMNYLHYDACSIGNHDIETGHRVYDRLHHQFNYPTIVANIINVVTGHSYFPPYVMLHKAGKKIAILGLITPAVPAWLPEKLWEGMRFDDMEETAKRWMPIIQAEKPDLIIGLFHSGNNSDVHAGDYKENASMEVAKNVPGFNIIFTGHDHIPMDEVITNVAGEQVIVMNPGANGLNVAHVRAQFDDDVQLSSKLKSVADEMPDSDYLKRFKKAEKDLDKYVSQKIGKAEGDFISWEAMYGPSAFMNLLHTLQLRISNADISLAAPLSTNVVIHQGPITVSDMFKLYKYENSLYVLKLTGKEIKNYLERSYAMWTNQLDENSRIGLLSHKTPTYNYDSAYGINYTVDVTRPEGEKIEISGFTDGRPFQEDEIYTVAVNSYRAEGGGDLFTKGAKIPREELTRRVVWRSDRDLRHYLMEQIRISGSITPSKLRNWEFVPEPIATRAITIDRSADLEKD